MKLASFAYQFGFPTGLPAQFNNFRHRAGITPWTIRRCLRKILTTKALTDSLYIGINMPASTR